MQAQAVEAALASGESESIGQAWQVSDDEAPMVGENWPAAQLVQKLTPPAAANLPAAQLVHDEAPLLAEYVPSLQSLHACVPGAPLNVPAAHGAHALPLGPVCPGAHVHALPPAASAS